MPGTDRNKRLSRRDMVDIFGGAKFRWVAGWLYCQMDRHEWKQCEVGCVLGAPLAIRP